MKFCDGVAVFLEKFAFGTFLLASLTLAGCSSSTETRAQAGSVSFTVSALSPWSQVASTMSPNFSAKADSLVSSTFAATEWQESQLLQALGLSASVTLPGASASSTSMTVPVTNLPAEATQTPTGPGGIDPLLQYEAARNLYQSIQLMNHEMQLIASGSCYEPYLIMAKLSVVPYRSDLSEALQARVSFYPNPYNYKVDYQNLAKQQSDPALDLKNGCNQPGWLPRVIPILASDDLERAVRADSAEVATQISLALGGAFHGLGGALGVNHLSETLNAINGSDFNNRMTVYREADNTIGIRINPSFDIGSGSINPNSTDRNLIGQNYDIALILLVPKAFASANNGTSQKDKYIESIMTTEFVNPQTAERLPDNTAAYLGTQTKQLVSEAITGDAGGDQFLADDKDGLTALGKAYGNLSPQSWARIGRVLIYFSQQDKYDDFTSLFVNQDSDQGSSPKCDDSIFQSPLKYDFPNLKLPYALQLDDASQCLLKVASSALRLAPNSIDQEQGYLFTRVLPALWSGASQLSVDDAVQVAMTPLPAGNFLQLPVDTSAATRNADVLLVKDSSGNLNGSFAPVSLSSDNPVDVELVLNKTVGNGPKATLHTMALLDPNDPTGHTLTFSFPNAASLSTIKDGVTAGTILFTLVSAPGSAEDQTCISNLSATASAGHCPTLSVILVSAPKSSPPSNGSGAEASGAKATFSLANQPSQVVVGPGSTGKITLGFTAFTDSKITVSTDSGGDIDSDSLTTSTAASGTSLSLSGGSLVIAQPTTPPTKQTPLAVEIPLRNLKAGRKLTLTLKGSGTKQPTTISISLSVYSPT